LNEADRRDAIVVCHTATLAFGVRSTRAALSLSFTGCFQILKCRLPECESKSQAAFEAWYQGVLWEMQLERTDPRRNRINPRVIKRKMSKWK